MRKFALSLDSYKATTMVRVWCGCAMVGAKRAQITGEFIPFPCGCIDQILEHVIGELSFVSSPLFPAVSHLLPYFAGSPMQQRWRERCNRVIHILTSNRQKPAVEHVVRGSDLTRNGHIITYAGDMDYVYCTKCHVARRAREVKWLFNRPCPSPNGPQLREGHSFDLQGHQGTLQLRAWKRSSM